ncbi:MAG TPA: hypothetical protein VGI39_01335 [Polyangiaceae bacterium]|jgi:hypothetical protein
MTEPRDIADQDLLTRLIGHIEEGGTRDGSWKIARQYLVQIRPSKGRKLRCLTPSERAWANKELDRYEPRGPAAEPAPLVAPRRPVPTPAVLQSLPLRPPGRA